MALVQGQYRQYVSIGQYGQYLQHRQHLVRVTIPAGRAVQASRLSLLDAGAAGS
jgi:hypothetical protein